MFAPSIVGAVVVLTSLWSQYPEYHLLELLLAAGLLAAPIAYELYTRGWRRIPIAMLVAASFLGAFVCYFWFGTYVPPEAPIEGVLSSADEVTPKAGCGDWGGLLANIEDPKRPIHIAMGDSEAVIPFYKASVKPNPTPDLQALADKTNRGPRTILRIGTCRALRVERTEGGLGIEAMLAYRSGSVAARIVGNRFTLVPAEFTHSEAPDRSTLLLKGPTGKRLLWIKYNNPNSLSVLGEFGCKDSPTVSIGPGRIIIGGKSGVRLRQTCLMLEWPEMQDRGKRIHESEGIIVDNNGSRIGSGSTYIGELHGTR